MSVGFVCRADSYLQKFSKKFTTNPTDIYGIPISFNLYKVYKKDVFPVPVLPNNTKKLLLALLMSYHLNYNNI